MSSTDNKKDTPSIKKWGVTIIVLITGLLLPPLLITTVILIDIHYPDYVDLRRPYEHISFEVLNLEWPFSQLAFNLVLYYIPSIILFCFYFKKLLRRLLAIGLLLVSTPALVYGLFLYQILIAFRSK